MPRPNDHSPEEGHAGGGGKIRKRGCSSSSSTSSVLRSYRLKRAILVGRRGGTSTPVPTWRINARSPCSSAGMSNCSHFPPPHAGGKAKQAPVSARKLATALWELNEIPAPQLAGNSEEGRLKRRIMRGRDRMPKSVQSGSLPPHLSDPSHSPVSETTDRSESGGRRRGMCVLSQKHGLNERNHRAPGGSVVNGSSMEIANTHSRGCTPTSSSTAGVRNRRLKHLTNSLTASNELLKILNRIWGLEEQHSSSASLVSALHTELGRACILVDQLIEDQRSERDEINCLKRRFMEEKSARTRKEQERIASATESIMEELELEKKLRRRSERLSQELEAELTEAKRALASVMKELEGERRSREIIEQVCDELVRGIGEDKAQAEEMKRESAEALEELEREREMLQLADMWREERVQMKLSEAKYHFEEKNAAVDQLRNELEAFLATKRSKGDKPAGAKHVKEQEAGEERQLVQPGQSCFVGTNINIADRTNEDGEVDDDAEENDDEVGSADSDLHSIELNMDNNSKGYSWGYATTGNSTLDGRKFASVEGKYKGRSSSSNDKTSRRSFFSIERGGTPEDNEQEFDGADFQHLGEVVDRGRVLSEGTAGLLLLKKQTRKLDHPDADRYKSVIKGLRDHLLSGSRFTSAGGFTSPTRQWTPPQPSLEEGGHQVCGGLNVAEMVIRAIREGGLNARQGPLWSKLRGEGHN